VTEQQIERLAGASVPDGSLAASGPLPAPVGPPPPPGADTPPPPPSDGPRKHRHAEHRRSFWRELPVLIIVAVGLALLIKTFLLQAFFIPSGSMEKTLAIGDRVLVNKLVYDFRDPHRGEIVVFNGKKACTNASVAPTGCGWGNLNESTVSPANGISRILRDIQSFIGLGSPNEHDFIKRVVAVGGDTVSCPAVVGNLTYCDKVTVNGVALDESGYVLPENQSHDVFGPYKIPKGQLWVMGDHRNNSNDSRSNGSIAISSVVGRAFVTVWPPSHVGGHGVPKDFNQHFTTSALGTAALPPAAGLAAAVPVVLIRRRRLLRRARTRTG
jgi:signal peptidase I